MDSISIKTIFIIFAAVWAGACFLYFFVFNKKSVKQELKKTAYVPNQDIINYPKPFFINIIVEKEQAISSALVCDLMIKYSDMLNNSYTLPKGLQNNTIEPVQENEAVHVDIENEEITVNQEEEVEQGKEYDFSEATFTEYSDQEKVETNDYSFEQMFETKSENEITAETNIEQQESTSDQELEINIEQSSLEDNFNEQIEIVKEIPEIVDIILPSESDALKFDQLNSEF